MIGITITPSHIDYPKILTPNTVENLIIGDCIIISGAAKENAPVDQGELKNSIMWTTQKNEDGFNKGGGKKRAPQDARLAKPTSNATGFVGSGVAHAGPVENGVTKAYYIKAKPGKMLAWKGKDGKMHFARKVLHPPMKAQPYLRPAGDNSKKQREARHKQIIDTAIKQAYHG